MLITNDVRVQTEQHHLNGIAVEDGGFVAKQKILPKLFNLGLKVFCSF